MILDSVFSIIRRLPRRRRAARTISAHGEREKSCGWMVGSSIDRGRRYYSGGVILRSENFFKSYFVFRSFVKRVKNRMFRFGNWIEIVHY